MTREQINIVVVGHVDHGKSTVIGRLLADTGSLPRGKLRAVKALCEKNARPFEYSFLLDVLKDEQSQGITIDTARCFFKTKKRDYIILDAPGHIEFLKNMVTGASHAEAALLVIDAAEGIQENSKRHGHMVSMLGIKQVAVLVNKMDLVNYDKLVFEKIRLEYKEFLKRINIEPIDFIPVSAREGDNIARSSGKMEWYEKKTVLDQLDGFHKSPSLENLPFRMPVQDIYKFTQHNDDRRIIAGTVATGSVSIGDEVRFLPSRKISAINTIENFNTEKSTTSKAGKAAGFTLNTQIYIRPGELMVKREEEQPRISSRFKANIFWVGRAPLIKDRSYKLKLAAARTSFKLVEVVSVLDASDLSSDLNKQQVDRHDVAECILETVKPVAYDIIDENEQTGRFVIVDNYEIAGGGIIQECLDSDESILKEHIREREIIWEKGSVSPLQRADVYKHSSKFVVITGPEKVGKRNIAKALEQKLFDNNFKAYYLGITNIEHGLYSDIIDRTDIFEERIRRLGELARIITDSGQIFITTIDDADDFDIEKLKLLNEPNEILVINVGNSKLNKFPVNLILDANEKPDVAVEKIFQLLREKEIILEYYL